MQLELAVAISFSFSVRRRQLTPEGQVPRQGLL
jgi:hypothetical protein